MSNEFLPQFKKYIASDPRLMRILRAAATLRLPDWFVGAGAVRNSLWDILESFPEHTPLADVDVVYFDPSVTAETREKEYERELRRIDTEFPWSVKNQARMAAIYSDEPYQNTCDGIGHWVETATCVGVRLQPDGSLIVCVPFGVGDVMNRVARINPKWPRPRDFISRMQKKQWNRLWPGVRYLEPETG